MNLPIILAHGALGAFDEIIFIAAAVLFATLMGVAWWRARGDVVIDELADEESTAAEPTPTSTEAPDRFKLE